LRLDTLQSLFEELVRGNLGRLFGEGDTNEIIISLHKHVFSIGVSELNDTELSQNLSKDNSELIINGLVENHMVNESIDCFSNSSQSFNTVNIDMLEELIDLSWTIRHLLNQGSHELYQVRVVVVDAEVEAVEKGHLVLINIIRVLCDNINDLLVQLVLF